DECGKVFEEDSLKPGKTFQFTFADAGTYDYFCSVHPWMTGQVIVAAGATTSTTPAMSDNMTMQSGNAAVPEFGPVASIVLAIAVMSMVVFAAKTRGIPKF
ncbi:MAG TPA: plastocyanin/azurin family copper-binding protein, partial [Candidatus Nitrosotalea sp.]|nr:plastocyanin/azurin family copper-binding protein [Candidatus Nitrosotalea sp.]